MGEGRVREQEYSAGDETRWLKIETTGKYWRRAAAARKFVFNTTAVSERINASLALSLTSLANPFHPLNGNDTRETFLFSETRIHAGYRTRRVRA